MINYADLIGVPFIDKGRDIKQGLDCYGLCIEIFKRYGKNIPEYYKECTEYTDLKTTTNIYEKHKKENAIWESINVEDITEPCLIAIRFGVPQGIVNHTGVYIGNGKFIHIRENTGVCIDRINSPAWKRMIVGCYKYIGDEK